MNDIERGQLNLSAAEVYDEFYLPALFNAWTGPVVEAALISSGDRVLDVACGTGVLAIAAAEQVGPDGEVVGLDINEGMLAVAGKKSDVVEWRHGRAEALPFEEGHFDAVVSQFGLMFFEDKQKAVNEMVRVLKPGGQLAVAVWDSLENTPGYAAVTRLLGRLFGKEVADALRAPYSLGDQERLESLFSVEGLESMRIVTVSGRAVFPSLSSWMYTDVKGWTLADKLDDEQYERLLDAAEEELVVFVEEGGQVSFDAPAHIITATKTQTDPAA